MGMPYCFYSIALHIQSQGLLWYNYRVKEFIMETIVQLEDGRIIGISKDFRVLEYLDGEWVKPQSPVYGSDLHDGKPISEEEL